MVEIAGEVEHRFDQPDLKIIKDIEQLAVNASNGETVAISDSIIKYFEDYIDPIRLKAQLSMLPDMIGIASNDSIPIKQVANVQMIADAMEKSNVFKGMLTEIDKLMRIYFTYPEQRGHSLLCEGLKHILEVR